MIALVDSKQILETKQVYNTIAEHFSATRQFLWDDMRPLARLVQTGDTVLDVGCGNGRLYQLFEKKPGGFTYVGLDQSEALIEIARRRFPLARFVVHEMTKLPFKKAQFDVVFCIAAFHHLPSRGTRLKALREMKKVTKIGGRIVLTNWNLCYAQKYEKYKSTKKITEGKDFFIPWKDKNGNFVAERYYHGFSVKELTDLAIAAELKIEKQYTTVRDWEEATKEEKNIVTILRKEFCNNQNKTI